VVQRGETLSGIAARHNVPLAELVKANPEVTNPNLIEVGQRLRLPSADGYSPPAPTAPVPMANAPAAGMPDVEAAQARMEAYARDKGIGQPTGDARFLHGKLVQDYSGGPATEGPCMVVDGPNGPQVVRNDFHKQYVGGAEEKLGAPLDAEHMEDGRVVQNFERGRMTWTPEQGTRVELAGGATGPTGPGAPQGQGDLGQLVESVYQSELGRPSDPGGMATWKAFAEQQRAQGKSDAEIRGMLVDQFRQSEEYRARNPAQPQGPGPVTGVEQPPPGSRVDYGPQTVGYHATPDLLTQYDPNTSPERIRNEIANAAAQGAKSMTVVVNGNSSPEALKTALDAAAAHGMQLNVRVNHGDWSPTLPFQFDPNTHQARYDAAAGQQFKQNLTNLFSGLSDTQKRALGAVQLGNEPMDIKEWPSFAGKGWGPASGHPFEYQDWLNQRSRELGISDQELASRISRSVGLATRDMLVDVAPALAQVLGGDASKIATPPMGAGWAKYNNYTAQKEFFLGLMGVEANGQRGRSGLDYVGQVGVHAYVDNNAIQGGVFDKENSSLTGYQAALDEYRARYGADAPGSQTARPTFTEVGLDNHYPGGQGRQLQDIFMKQIIQPWNEAHPKAQVADVSVWGWYPSYNSGGEFEDQWKVKDSGALGNSVREVNG
jgi:hypothetical protein